MKKTLLFIVLFIILTSVVWLYLANFKNTYTEGDPIFNETIEKAKNHGFYIESYKQASNKEILFNEIWLERKGYNHDRLKTISDSLLILKFSFKNKSISNLKILSTNFGYIGYGYPGEIFNIEIINKSILYKDSLKIIFYPNNKITLVKNNSYQQ